MDFNKLVAGQVIQAEGWWWLTEYGTLTFCNHEVDMSVHGYIKLCRATCTGQMPDDFNAVQVQVDAVDGQIEHLKESYHQKLHELTEKRENLLALPAPAQTVNFDDYG